MSRYGTLSTYARPPTPQWAIRPDLAAAMVGRIRAPFRDGGTRCRGAPLRPHAAIPTSSTDASSAVYEHVVPAGLQRSVEAERVVFRPSARRPHDGPLGGP